jgi:hypothetical protein
VAKLEWGVAGERFYETGVDRGVLYIADSGVAWAGLISISESSSGGEAKPYYIDGVKFLNIAAAEEYTANLEAFYNPPEFAVCDGVVSVQNGLFVTQQPRKSFNFSYRTKIGNDVDMSNHAYKIHIVYNALAAPSDRQHTTTSDSPDPSTLSWDITTLSPSITGYKPTAHLVIDSRMTLGATLIALEDILYGSEFNDPRLPSPDELITLFA